jgi:SAM-dependent methyltransferase
MKSSDLRIDSIDQGQAFDWGKTSEDYARFRPGPPPSFYDKLVALGVGRPGTSMLDLGTGTGVVVREFAKRGVTGYGTDIAVEQIEMAKTLAAKENLTVTFKHGPAEVIPFSDLKVDAIIANQCWWYFDVAKVIPEIRRLLKNDGRLIVSHFNFAPRLDPVVAESEKLVLKYNPKWTGADWDGVVPPIPQWATEHFNLRAMFYYDEPIPFTHESWRGRMRACRGVSASLSAEDANKFDKDHEFWLKHHVAENFNVIHRIDAHVLEFKN